MIIKIKGFKKPAYGKLLNYILHDRDRMYDGFNKSFILRRNLKGKDMRSWISELQAIEKKRQHSRKGQLYMTHEILSWHREDSIHITLNKMQDMVREYMRLRGDNRAVWVAAPHLDREHYHCHIMVGALDRSGASMRMTRDELKMVKQQIQEYQISKYPELSKSVVRHGRKQEFRISDREYRQQLRTGTKTDRQEIKGIVKSCLEGVPNQQAFTARLHNAGLETYVRGGKLAGIIYAGKKYRFKKLGVEIDGLPIREKRRMILRKEENDRSNIER